MPSIVLANGHIKTSKCRSQRAYSPEHQEIKCKQIYEIATMIDIHKGFNRSIKEGSFLLK